MLSEKYEPTDTAMVEERLQAMTFRLKREQPGKGKPAS